MRKSEVMLTLSLLASAAMAAWLWIELRDERALNAELTTRLNSPRVPVVAPEPAVAPAPPSVPASPSTAPFAVLSATTESSRSVQPTPEDMVSYQQRMLQQPKYREAWRAQQRLNYGRRRENVIRLLGFTPEEADAVVELAIDRQLSWYDRTPDKSMTEADSQQQQRAQYEQDQREDQEKLRALLGEPKAARFQEYMESRQTRVQVDELRPQFTGADALRDDQVEPLIAALHAERAQMQQELNEDRDNGSSSPRQPFYERQFELLGAAYKRMHSAAAPILSPSQVERLDALLKRDLERREAEIRLQRVQMKMDPMKTDPMKTD
jgi:hypothetical protein